MNNLSGKMDTMSSIEKNYVKLSEEEHPHFGSVNVYFNQSNNHKIQAYRLLYQDKSKLVQKLEQINIKKQLQGNQIIKYYDYSINVNNNWSKIQYELIQYIESCFQTYQECVLQKKVYLTEKDMLELLYQGIFFLNQLELRGLNHLEMSPEFIYYCEGQIKFLFKDHYDVVQWKKDTHFKIKQKKKLYLSPEVYDNFKNNNFNFPISSIKQDIFALGLCFLEIVGKYDIQKLYGEKFNKELLSFYMVSMMDKFQENKILINGVSSLLMMEEQHRPLPSSLINALMSYQLAQEMITEQKQQVYTRTSHQTYAINSTNYSTQRVISTRVITNQEEVKDYLKENGLTERTREKSINRRICLNQFKI